MTGWTGWMELDAVAACVIGGVSLKGGRGNVLGVIFGALIIACLINGMTLLAMKPDNKEFAGEAADLLYHLIVLLRAKKLSLADAIAVLEKRHAPKK